MSMSFSNVPCCQEIQICLQLLRNTLQRELPSSSKSIKIPVMDKSKKKLSSEDSKDLLVNGRANLFSKTKLKSFTRKWYARDGTIAKQNSFNFKSVPLDNLNDLQLRFLCPSDLSEVRTLCKNWFPIDYPYAWYEEITSNPKFYSLAALYEGVIVGLIVAEIRSYSKLNTGDRNILSSCFSKTSSVAYMLSLGVSETFRRNGIASLLLDNLVSHLTASENIDCKALFLHVLTTNKPAIRFYENRNFRLHSFLPYYYSIKGTRRDGFTYVLYLNGGHPPWGLYDYIKHYSHYLFRGDICRIGSFRSNTLFYKMLRKIDWSISCLKTIATIITWICLMDDKCIAWVVVWLRTAIVWVWPGVRGMAVENTTALVTQYAWVTK